MFDNIWLVLNFPDNSKIKTLDPKTRECKTWLGGEEAGWLATALFSEPGGLSIAGGKMYVADTNAHRVRVVDMKTKAVTTLKLTGVWFAAAGMFVTGAPAGMPAGTAPGLPGCAGRSALPITPIMEFAALAAVVVGIGFAAAAAACRA